MIGARSEDGASAGVGGNETDDSLDGSGAAYVLRRSGGTWVQEAYLKASNPGLYDNFGYAVAVSGDTLVVGAPYERSAATGVDGDGSDDSASSSGAAYVFVRSGSSWRQQAYLKASNTDPGDLFGWSVAIDGDTLVVGARAEESAATGVNGDATDNSAKSAGAAYVFVRSGTTWVQEAYLKASNTDGGCCGNPGVPGDRFGSAVTVSGDTVVVGAIGEDSGSPGIDGDQTDNSERDAGAAYIFVRSGGTWSQEAYLKASNPGGSPSGVAGDSFGWAVSLSGDRLVVGAPYEASADGTPLDNSAPATGAAYVFARSGATWMQEAYLKASNPDVTDVFGTGVGLTDAGLVVTAPGESGGNYDPSDESGQAAGAAYLFLRTGTAWSEADYLKTSPIGRHDRFGSCVAMSGESIVVGTIEEDSGSTGVDGDPNDNSAPGSGAAYVFGPSVFAPYCWSENSVGGRPRITAEGDPRSSLVLRSAPVSAGPGRFFFGAVRAPATPFGDSLLCVGGPRTTLSPVVRGMWPGSTATLAIDYGAPYAAGLTGVKHFQYWYRTGATFGTGHSTSNALSVTF